MKKPKTLIIKFNQKTHTPEFMGTEEPQENGDSIIKTLYGNINSYIELIPIPDEEEENE
jgi:hypothetical protein